MLPALFLLVCQADSKPAQQVPPPSTSSSFRTTGSRDVIDVADDTKLLEEKSLPLDSELNAASGSQHVSAPNVGGLIDNTENGNRGLRFYRFVLMPKERIKLQLNSLGNKITLRFAMPNISGDDPLVKAIKDSNRRPTLERQHRIELGNPFAEPVRVTLALNGYTNYNYKLEIQRELGK